MEMGERVYVKDINGNIIETEVRDEGEERIKELEEENKKLKKENKKLKEDNRFLTKISKEYMEKENIIEVTEFTELYKDELREENKKLKEEKNKLYIDYENLSNCNVDLIQENKKLKEELRIVKELYKANVD